MSTPATPMAVSKDSQKLFVEYASKLTGYMGQQYNMRARMQEVDRIYQREMDWTQAQRRAAAANKGGDASKVQNVTLPVVMPQVESQLENLADIFLTSYPIFPVFSKPQMMDEAMQMEAIIADQSTNYAWAAELLLAMRDGLKYDLLAVEVDWCVKKTFSITNDASKSVTQGTATVDSYAGNKVKRLNLYNTILDTRVPPSEIHTRGEFAGYTELISAIDMKSRIAELDPTMTMNATDALESGCATFTNSPTDGNYFIPQVNPNALITSENRVGDTNWDTWVGISADGSAIKYNNAYEWTVIYARILPSAFKMTNVPAKNTPQIYKFIIINRKVCIYVERKTNAHNYLPIIVAQATEDGLEWQSKSLADNAAGFQATASALFNSGLESQRRKVYDRIFYDPSRVNKSDIDNTSSVARIPVKTEAYGKPVSEAFAAVPYRDDNVNQIFNTAQMVTEMADVANRQNRVNRGQFQKGNKTRKEFETVMDGSLSSSRMTALVLENRLFTPLKTIIKTNILQYQQAGAIYDRINKQQIDVDPVKLRATAIEFKMADGLFPTSAYIPMETFQSMFQLAQAAPQMVQGYDLIGMFMYQLKLQGATWINDFKIQQQPQTQPGAANENTQPGAVAVGAPPATPQ